MTRPPTAADGEKGAPGADPGRATREPISASATARPFRDRQSRPTASSRYTAQTAVMTVAWSFIASDAGQAVLPGARRLGAAVARPIPALHRPRDSCRTISLRRPTRTCAHRRHLQGEARGSGQALPRPARWSGTGGPRRISSLRVGRSRRAGATTPPKSWARGTHLPPSRVVRSGACC